MEPWQQQLVAAGGRVYEVGGVVRDRLLQRPIKDADYLITGLPIEQLQAILHPLGRVNVVGKSFGVIKFSPRGSDALIDLAIPRKEISTGTGHTEFSVSFDHTLPVEIDLARRDFTINAMARDLQTGALLDPFGGQTDLAARQIRQVFAAAFPEDPLRLLRAVQFAARFGFTIAADTATAMRTHAALVATVSPERIIDEIGKLLRAPVPSVGFYLMDDVGLLAHVFPELAACRDTAQEKRANDNVLQHTMRVLDAARSDEHITTPGDLTLLFAALYHDVGKPKTYRYDPHLQRVTFFGHQLVSERIARKRLKALRVEMLGVDPDTVCHLVREHMFETKSFYTERAIRRFVAKIGPEHIERLLDLRLADNRGGKYPHAIKGVLKLRGRIREELAKKPPFGPKDLAITGHDLMAAGIPAGPQMGALLKALVEHCLDHPEDNTKEQLLALALAKKTAGPGEPVPAVSP